MKKTELMDHFLDSYGGRISSFEVYRVVHSIFGIDLDNIHILSKGKGETNEGLPSKGDLDEYLNQYGPEVTGTKIRKIINHIFGVNLDAISSLEGARISLYSKDQWIVQHEKDLFVVHTGNGDVDVKIYPTKYFTEQTGLGELPTVLRQPLTSLGYSFDEKIGSYYFLNPTGGAVPDDFKGQTIGAILKVIYNSYSDL